MNKNAKSQAAFEFIEPKRPSIRKRMYEYLMLHEATCQEMEVALGIEHQSASGRIGELRDAGLIELAGERTTRSGCKADVWRAVVEND